MSALAQQHGAVNVSQGFPDIPPPQGLVEAAVKALHDGAHQYAPMAGRLDSLNAATATAVTAFEWSRRHHGK
ncbi:MAG: hypothetical protein CMC97_00910 [Flavobacteriales bacterium]|nr:hypothetical protein [Flavobacteriales bacterium]